MLSNLFPEYVMVSCGLIRQYEARLKSCELPVELAGAIPSRRLEFLAGRYFAKLALKQLGAEQADDAIPILKSRAPKWPRGIVGSISHTHELAGAAVAREEDVDGLGLDIEGILSAELTGKISKIVSFEEEWSALSRSCSEDDCLKMTLIYAAKEAIFKCLSPLTGVFFDFHHVLITEIDFSASTFRAELRYDLTQVICRGTVLRGKFCIQENVVYTGTVFTGDAL